MFITDISIRRPVVSWVMSLILITFGIFVFWKLPVRELPAGIQPPVVQVQVDYSSAAAPIVDQEVTQVIEDVIGGAEGIKNIDSKSENGRSTINVEFDTSIIMEGEKTFVYKVTPEKIANKVEVKIGNRSEGKIEILSGLKEGDIIVAEGLKKVYPRAKIKPIKEGEEKDQSSWKKKEDKN